MPKPEFKYAFTLSVKNNVDDILYIYLKDSVYNYYSMKGNFPDSILSKAKDQIEMFRTLGENDNIGIGPFVITSMPMYKQTYEKCNGELRLNVFVNKPKDSLNAELYSMNELKKNSFETIGITKSIDERFKDLVI